MWHGNVIWLGGLLHKTFLLEVYDERGHASRFNWILNLHPSDIFFLSHAENEWK
jgi:hypothetical protein